MVHTEVGPPTRLDRPEVQAPMPTSPCSTRLTTLAATLAAGLGLSACQAPAQTLTVDLVLTNATVVDLSLIHI